MRTTAVLLVAPDRRQGADTAGALGPARASHHRPLTTLIGF
ncbi:hypothetical protein SCATT_01530 [Streptantibioticus cattleyicolor NRRL 8057 = DSM 46488]|uniref:Uncharacterized protein n=1 Tax=Streptantibioticus cattleyicolor (strain ATCC 35852 / DSM 46488 / JCM 4925 / NBRC 14057 / NRRL 8057) TaxID=1003195 RepID=G8X1J5_STREN|nr:hypothetical protein SCATT_01530 [Streptantibioticus cattleyicolor NRRL 8057 = DSM 46488]